MQRMSKILIGITRHTLLPDRTPIENYTIELSVLFSSWIDNQFLEPFKFKILNYFLLFIFNLIVNVKKAIQVVIHNYKFHVFLTLHKYYTWILYTARVK
jgi:hypothetical protein